jgi:MFS family permease
MGCCLGAIIFGILATKYGRKKLFMVTLIIYAISVLGCAFMPDYTSFTFFRFLTGIAVGGEYTAIFAAIDELIPP